MAKKRLLTFGSAGRWKKTIDGTTFYFGTGKSIDDTASYKRAERNYLEFLEQRAKGRPAEVPPEAKLTIGELADRFLVEEHGRYERREISADHFDRTRVCLRDFAHVVGIERPLADGMEIILNEYASHIRAFPKSKTTGNRIKPSTAKHRLDCVKAAFNWAYKLALIDRLPRNLQGYSKVKLPPPEVSIFEIDEVIGLLGAADERLRLWILLAINCGFGQKDIGDLTLDELSFDPPRIIRGRSKTDIEGQFALWPETINLLRPIVEHGDHPEGRVFVGQKGKPLVWSEFIDHKLRRGDAVRSKFDRLVRQTGIGKGRGFYSFRRTSANLIDKIDPPMARIFLAQVDRNMTRHYVRPDWDRLAEAIAGLRVRLQLGDQPWATGTQRDDLDRQK